MKPNKNYSFKLICYSLVILIVLQACGSSNVFYAKAESSLESIKKLEEHKSVSSKKLVLKIGDKLEVSSLYKVTTDSVFFKFKRNAVKGYTLKEIKGYYIQKRNVASGVGAAGLAASSAYAFGTAVLTQLDTWESIGHIVFAGFSGLVSIGLILVGSTLAEQTVIRFKETPTGIYISTTTQTIVERDKTLQ
jgi:hypothetical protein